MSNLLQTSTHHALEGFLQIHIQEVYHLILLFLGESRNLEEHHGQCIGLLLVLLDGYEGLLVVGHREIFANRSVGSCRLDISKHLLDLLLHLIHIHITHDDDTLQVGSIPTTVIGANGLVREVHHHLHGAYRHAVGIPAPFVQLMEGTLLHTHHSTSAQTPFLIDDTTLLVYLLAIQEQVMAPVMQDKQTGIESTGNLHVDIVDIIHRLVKGSVGIEVLAKLHTDTLQILLERITREMGSTIETHMFQEMSQSALTLLLLHGTHLLCYVEVCTLLRPLVVTDIISESIRQDTHLDSRVQGYRAT